LARPVNPGLEFLETLNLNKESKSHLLEWEYVKTSSPKNRLLYHYKCLKRFSVLELIYEVNPAEGSSKYMLTIEQKGVPNLSLRENTNVVFANLLDLLFIKFRKYLVHEIEIHALLGRY